METIMGLLVITRYILENSSFEVRFVILSMLH